MSITWKMPTKFWSLTPAVQPTRVNENSTEGKLIYAVGDIHGRRDLLQQITRKIIANAIDSGAEQQPILIFLGDYIDRGLDSNGVVNYILALRALNGFDVRCLKGNHEQTLLRFYEDSSIGPVWMEHGGGATLASYGVTAPSMRGDKAGWEEARLAFQAALPAAHLEFYQTLDLSLTIGDYFFVHAGVRPGVPLVEQSEQDLLWSRVEFLGEKKPFEKIIVHGHTPVEEPFLGEHRIAVDTGAYATGTLSAVRLEGDQKAIVSTSV